jgi:hypothetical protein
MKVLMTIKATPDAQYAKMGELTYRQVSMRAVSSILFPWQDTFKKLELQKHWWHRLAVVAFFIVLVLMIGASLVLAFSSLQPYPSSMPDIQYWSIDTDGNPEQITLGPVTTQAQYDAAMKEHNAGNDQHFPPMPVGSQALIAPTGVSIDWSAPITAKVDMPDGTTGEFVHKSDAEITVAWKKALNKALSKAWLLTIGIVTAVALAFSYLFQSLYRALLYVIYGSNNGQDITHSGGPA